MSLAPVWPEEDCGRRRQRRRGAAPSEGARRVRTHHHHPGGPLQDHGRHRACPRPGPPPRSPRWTDASGCRCSWTARPAVASRRPRGRQMPRCSPALRTSSPCAPGRSRAFGASSSTVEQWEVAVVHRDHAMPHGSCARVTWLSGDADLADRAPDVYKMAVLPRLQEFEGFCSASLLVSRDTGRIAGTVTFETRAQLEATRQAVVPIRERASQELRATVDDVAEMEAFAHLPCRSWCDRPGCLTPRPSRPFPQGGRAFAVSPVGPGPTGAGSTAPSAVGSTDPRTPLASRAWPHRRSSTVRSARGEAVDPAPAGPAVRARCPTRAVPRRARPRRDVDLLLVGHHAGVLRLGAHLLRLRLPTFRSHPALLPADDGGRAGRAGPDTAVQPLPPRSSWPSWCCPHCSRSPSAASSRRAG